MPGPRRSKVLPALRRCFRRSGRAPASAACPRRAAERGGDPSGGLIEPDRGHQTIALDEDLRASIELLLNAITQINRTPDNMAVGDPPEPTREPFDVVDGASRQAHRDLDGLSRPVGLSCRATVFLL